MSKAEILDGLAKLSAIERGEVWEALWEMEAGDISANGTPNEDEKGLLDREWEEFHKSGERGSLWQDVKARLRNDP